MTRFELASAHVFALVVASTASPAFAYIDPNIGGQIAQLLTPLVTMIVAALAFARHWIRAKVGQTASWFKKYLGRAPNP